MSLLHPISLSLKTLEGSLIYDHWVNTVRSYYSISIKLGWLLISFDIHFGYLIYLVQAVFESILDETKDTFLNDIYFDIFLILT